ncbi:uncharacterized protein TM35_000302530 [Trypanosoma theileri]|uniref:Uncharacterized protein n=1 Tax=Trypanosoma theileri TaxID=67003 RepID=A0A1X0NNZ1_9TRYP|nr:uncharacterized protein TM35_000302530 [Trypanosoma theileri]ORC86213.1 hypothetical protein TM35_000302530 [Trypanosoma theileri]
MQVSFIFPVLITLSVYYSVIITIIIGFLRECITVVVINIRQSSYMMKITTIESGLQRGDFIRRFLPANGADDWLQPVETSLFYRLGRMAIGSAASQIRRHITINKSHSY